MTTQCTQAQASRSNSHSRKAYIAALALFIEVLTSTALALPNEQASTEYDDAIALEATPAGECKAVCPLPAFSDDTVPPALPPALPQVLSLLD